MFGLGAPELLIVLAIVVLGIITLITTSKASSINLN